MERNMNVVFFVLGALLITTPATAKNDIDNDISESFASTTANSLDSINLRKALLRALTELENEEVQKDDDDISSKTIFFSTTAKTPERIIEKASASAISFLANDNSEEPVKSTTETSKNEDSDQQQEEKTEKPIVIIQKSDGVQHRPIISVLNENNEETNEALSLSASSSFHDETNKNNFIRSSPKPVNNLNLNAVTVNDKSFTPGVKSVSITPKYETGSTTTPRPTPTTEESEAKVEDVQFFSAPLVAAFTVHQDERGLPNKVEPIFKQAGQSAVSVSEVADKQRQEVLRQEEIKREEYRRQLEAEAKQKSLEFQLKTLQEQQKQQQEYLVRQQRIIQDQQLQHQRLLEEQARLNQNDRPFLPILNSVHSTTERPVFFTTTNSNSFNSFQKAREINPTITNFNGGVNVQSTPNPLSLNGVSNSLPPSPPKFFQELPLTTPSPLFNQNLNQNQNQLRFNNNFNNLNNLNSNLNQNGNNFNGNFKNTFNNNFNNLNGNNNQNSKFNKFQNTVVSLQSSLSLSPGDLQSGKLPLNAQILPVRNAIDFHQSPNPNLNLNNNFNFRQPTLLNQQQQFFPNSFQSFPNNNNNNFNNVRQGTRVFRQESNTANFGFNNNFNQNTNQNFNNQAQSFSIQQSLEPPSRFFRSNSEQFQTAPGLVNKNVYQPQNVNQQLNTLLYHSGITRNVRQNDDLHIVSKILSFNLGRDNVYAGSRVHEQRVKH